jgi:heme-degrading monooxygenase HmoA
VEVTTINPVLEWKEALMFLCIIEFGIKPEMEKVNAQLLQEMFAELATFEGFLGKESFLDAQKPDRRISISYWRDQDALARWMKNLSHLRVIRVGKRDVFTHYEIRIAEMKRERSWRAPGFAAPNPSD